MAKKHTLIKTKLTVPHGAAMDIVRERALGTLSRTAEHRLTLVSAPAGFGKTTVLKQWVRSVDGSVAWLSLDAGDDRSEVFLAYFIAALQKLDPRIGTAAMQYLESANRFEISKTIAGLVNDLYDNESDLFLVIDDFHFIESRDVIQFIEVLVNLSPPNFHLLLASRTTPDMPIASGYVHGDVLHLSVDDLRFDENEAKVFFQSHEIEISEGGNFDQIFSSSEGWVAGLQLASLYLGRSYSDQGKLAQLSGNLRDIADYLAIEVLDQLSPELKRFLIRLSILKRFNAALSDALLSIEGSRRLLHDAEAKNLFLVALDEGRNWYRFHHLFQDFLRDRLRELPGEEVTGLYRRASDWFADQQLFHEAVEYALEGRLFDRAAALIEEHTITEFVRGRMPRVNDWINRVPQGMREKYPRLLLLQGTALFHMNAHAEAQRVCNSVEESIARLYEFGEFDEQALDAYGHESKILQAGIHMAADRNRSVLSCMPDSLSSSTKFGEGTAHNVIAYAHYRLGNFEAALQHIASARAAHEAIDAKFGVVYSDCFQAMVEIARGNLGLASSIFEAYRATPASERHIYVTSVVDVMAGVIAYERNDLAKAQELLQSSLQKVEEVGHLRVAMMGYTVLVKIAAAKGEFARAYKVLGHMLVLVGAHPIEEHRLYIGALRIKILLDDAKPAEALNLATVLNVPLDDEVPDYPSSWSEPLFLERITQLRLQQHAGLSESLHSLLDPLLAYLERSEQTYHYFEVLALRLRHLSAMGDEDGAAALLVSMVRRLAPQSMYRLLLDEGEAVRQSIRRTAQLASTETDPVQREFLAACLGSFDEGRATESSSAGLVEPLSPRELKIISLMSEGKSNTTIANELFISESTVKWHGSNIFGKLRVRNRTAAVITAKELKLID